MKVVWGIMNSELFKNDNEFIEDFCREKGITIQQDLTDDQQEELDDKKLEYYDGDFWYDCDHINIQGRDYAFVKADKEIILMRDGQNEMEDDSDRLDSDCDLIQNVLLHYFGDKWNDKSIAPNFDRGDWNAKLTNRKDADIWIKYRGGQGYCYAFCGYNSKDFIS